jgi:hypothetical protein
LSHLNLHPLRKFGVKAFSLMPLSILMPQPSSIECLGSIERPLLSCTFGEHVGTENLRYGMVNAKTFPNNLVVSSKPKVPTFFDMLIIYSDHLSADHFFLRPASFAKHRVWLRLSRHSSDWIQAYCLPEFLYRLSLSWRRCRGIFERNR